MDLARFATKRPCTFFVDSAITIPIKWYRCPPGAKFFPFPHKWGHLDWYSAPWEAKGVGENYDGAQTWFNGATPPGVTGQTFHGPAEYFRDGCKFDASQFVSRNAFGVMTQCTGEPPVGPPVEINLCGEGQYWLSRTLIFHCDVDPSIACECNANGNVEIPITYNPLNGNWEAEYSAPVGPNWAISFAKVRFNPLESFGLYEFKDWVVSKIGEPDCNFVHERTFRLIRLCETGFIRRNPFFVGFEPKGYFTLCDFNCGYYFYVTDPADD